MFSSHWKCEVYLNLHAWPIEKWLWIWVLQPRPQLHECQGSWSALSRQRATVKLILLWLFPGNGTVIGSLAPTPGPCLLILQWLLVHCHCMSDQRRQERTAFPQTPQQIIFIWLNFQLPIPHQPVCNTHLVSTAVAASSAKVFPSATSFHTWFCEAAFTEKLFGQNSLQMNKTKTVFIKEILETATSAVFGLLCNYILARKCIC